MSSSAYDAFFRWGMHTWQDAVWCMHWTTGGQQGTEAYWLWPATFAHHLKGDETTRWCTSCYQSSLYIHTWRFGRVRRDGVRTDCCHTYVIVTNVLFLRCTYPCAENAILVPNEQVVTGKWDDRDNHRQYIAMLIRYVLISRLLRGISSSSPSTCCRTSRRSWNIYSFSYRQQFERVNSGLAS